MQQLKPTISIIVPALNEENNIAAAVDEVLRAVEGRFADYELLLFDDGSTDRTGTIMDQIARGNSRIRVIHNPHPYNLGGVYKQGVALARMEYLTWVPGDNENPSSAMIPVFEAIGRAAIVVPYPLNMEVRPLGRRIISRMYTMLMNLLFGYQLPYYNGTSVYPVASLRSIAIRTDSFAFQGEVLVKLLRRGLSYVTVGIPLQAQHNRISRAFRWRNVITVVQALVHLFVEIYFQKGHL